MVRRVVVCLEGHEDVGEHRFPLRDLFDHAGAVLGCSGKVAKQVALKLGRYSRAVHRTLVPQLCLDTHEGSVELEKCGPVFVNHCADLGGLGESPGLW
jgi:hypothetical protein